MRSFILFSTMPYGTVCHQPDFMLYGGCLFDNIDMASAKFARRHDIA
jgi:hypothetical protein